MLCDYHVHSTCSGDGHVSIEEMCARAVELGIGEIAFTEHFDGNPLDMSFGAFDYERYISEIEAARAKHGDLRILTGIEFGEPHVYPAQVEAVRAWNLDVVLAAVHWVGDTIVAVDQFHDAEHEALYDNYFSEVLKSVEAGGFDVLAHFDLVKRFGVRYAGPFDFGRFKERIAAILQAMIGRGIALEVNTSGLRQPCGETFPGTDTLRLYRDLGGEMVTIGSDAHRLDQLGFGLREGMALIEQAGFNTITRIQARRPEAVPLDVVLAAP